MATLDAATLRALLDDPEVIAAVDRRKRCAELCREGPINNAPILLPSLVAAYTNVRTATDLTALVDAADAEERATLEARIAALSEVVR